METRTYILPLLLLLSTSPFLMADPTHYPDKIYIQSHQFRRDSHGYNVSLNGEMVHVPFLYQDRNGSYILERDIQLPSKEPHLSSTHCPGAGCDCLHRMAEWGDDRTPPSR